MLLAKKGTCFILQLVFQIQARSSPLRSLDSAVTIAKIIAGILQILALFDDALQEMGESLYVGLVEVVREEETII